MKNKSIKAIVNLAKREGELRIGSKVSFGSAFHEELSRKLKKLNLELIINPIYIGIIREELYIVDPNWEKDNE